MSTYILHSFGIEKEYFLYSLTRLNITGYNISSSTRTLCTRVLVHALLARRNNALAQYRVLVLFRSIHWTKKEKHGLKQSQPPRTGTGILAYWKIKSIKKSGLATYQTIHLKNKRECFFEVSTGFRESTPLRIHARKLFDPSEIPFFALFTYRSKLLFHLLYPFTPKGRGWARRKQTQKSL